jgi:ribosomal protein S18 acetylase RimI-like enzyme
LVKNERITEPELTQLIQAQQDPLLVATLNNTIVGCIQAEHSQDHPQLKLPPRSVLLGLFAVDPAHQSRGIGRRLLQACISYAQQKWPGCVEHAVIWVIEQRQDILKWYERMGFEFTGEFRDFVMPQNALIEGLKFKIYVKRVCDE